MRFIYKINFSLKKNNKHLSINKKKKETTTNI